jgi:hypothetical protein
MWWSLAGAVLSFPPFYYCFFAIILFVKWMLWFPVMMIRHGLDDALDAALTTATERYRTDVYQENHIASKPTPTIAG